MGEGRESQGAKGSANPPPQPLGAVNLRSEGGRLSPTTRGLSGFGLGSGRRESEGEGSSERWEK